MNFFALNPRHYFFALLFVAASSSAMADLPPSVLQSMKRQQLPESALSVWVQAIDSNKPRITHNALVPRNPASVMKVPTTLAALDLLGPEYTWHTGLYSDGALQGDVLKGNLYLRGSGDPEMTLERFWLMLYRLRNLGIRTIQGDVVLDNSAFKLPPFDPAAFDDSPLRPYNGEAQALLINFHHIRLDIESNEQTVSVHSEPTLDNVVIDNRLTTNTDSCGNWKQSVGLKLIEENPRRKIVLTGRFPKNCSMQSWFINPMQGKAYVAELWRSLWAYIGGQQMGQTRWGTTPNTARQLVDFESYPLEDLIRHMNKYSNNMMAQQIFLSLGALQPTTPNGETEFTSLASRQTIEAWMKDQGIDTSGVVIDNGSGLSRENRLTAKALGQMLQNNARGPFMPIFISSISSDGMRSPLQRRIRQENGLRDRVFLKSGHLADVHALAGYVLDHNDRWQVVVLLVQNRNAGLSDPVLTNLVRGIYEGEY